MNMKSVFEFFDYKAYLKLRLAELPRKGRGERRRLAEALKCNTTYISQVLAGPAHLSPEQTERANRFLNHSKDEGQFFFLLVQHGRAGTPELREFLSQQLGEIQERRNALKNRLKFEKALRSEDQATYYSAWYYTAIHFLISLPQFQTPRALSAHLHLPMTRVLEVLDFLTKKGLASHEGERYVTGQINIHLGTDSPMLSKHHTNWRMQAIADLDRGELDKRHLHYSSIVTISEKDVSIIREALITAIEKVRAVVRESREERLYCYALDFFQVGGLNNLRQ